MSELPGGCVYARDVFCLHRATLRRQLRATHRVSNQAPGSGNLVDRSMSRQNF